MSVRLRPLPRPIRAEALARLLAPLLAAAIAACGGTPVTTTPVPSDDRATPAPSTPVPGRATASGPVDDGLWPVKTRRHLDLWLHGYAMLTADTARVPLFRPGYQADALERRRAANVLTSLDANRDALLARLRENPALVNGQFVPLYFQTWDELRAAATAFLDAGGNPRRARTEAAARQIAFFASSFPAAADREWLRLFLLALESERTRFYDAHWTAEQERQLPVYQAVDSLWRRVYRPKLQGFLTNTRQRAGDLLLTLPLGGEGRTVTGGESANLYAVTYPETRADAPQAIYVLAHELVGELAAQVITDNVSPAERREGVAERLQSPAAVRAGHLLLRRAAPELAEGYVRYYLGLARTAPGADATAAFERAFPLPDDVRDGILRQLDVVLGGI